MEINNFDIYWKLALMILLLLGMAYMFYEFNKINKEGIACYSAPFEYGKREAEKQGLYCSYNCYSGRLNALWHMQINLTDLNLTP